MICLNTRDKLYVSKSHSLEIIEHLLEIGYIQEAGLTFPVSKNISLRKK